jgi:CO/xanthine dehydrogenase Mo-binding subunit
MRWRGVAVITQHAAAVAAALARADAGQRHHGAGRHQGGEELGLDQIAIRRINSPEGKALYGPPRPNGQRGHITSAFVKEAFDRGAELFKWTSARRGPVKRQGTKVRGIGVAVGPHAPARLATTV